MDRISKPVGAVSGSSGVGSGDREILSAQRGLRERLLDRSVIRYAPARDLAAHMLLNLDDLPTCWSLATHWLRRELGCDRVDTGFGQARSRAYLPGYAEAKNTDYDIPSFGGAIVFNLDPGMQAMWHSSRPLVFADIKHDRRVSAYLRQRMSGARTKSKFGAALRDDHGSFGLICADWTERVVPHRSDLHDVFESTVADVLGPIIGIARRMQAAGANGKSEPLQQNSLREASLRERMAVNDPPGSLSAPVPQMCLLTASEFEIARLVAQGLSYKDIARIRGRSLSTIDHQLRSIRQKTGAGSMAALVSFLAKIDDMR